MSPLSRVAQQAHDLRGSVTCMSVIESKESSFLIAGTSNGEVGLFDIQWVVCIAKHDFDAHEYISAGRCKVSTSLPYSPHRWCVSISSKITSTYSLPMGRLLCWLVETSGLSTSNQPCASTTYLTRAVRPIHIPASSSPLVGVHRRETQLLAVYANGLARLYDIESGTLQKCLDKAGSEDVLRLVMGWTFM